MSATQQSATGPNSFQPMGQRAITAVITLGQGTFGQSGASTVILDGLKAEVTIQKASSPSFDLAEIRLYGVQPSIMNQVSTLGVPFPQVRTNNTVQVQAGDLVSGMGIVYQGYLSNAYQNYDGMPETMLELIGLGARLQALVPASPTSYPGPADVATIMSGLADQMGLAFENSGVQVQVQLSSPYFAGTLLQQAKKCAEAANIELTIDTGEDPPTLAIWPKTGTRGGLIPLISAASGMIGYPAFSSNGMRFTTLFNPNIRIGGLIQMQSSLGTALLYSNPAKPTPETIVAGGPNGIWYVRSVTHELSSWVPDGPWFTTAECARTQGPNG